jgi:hypothetical protein
METVPPARTEPGGRAIEGGRRHGYHEDIGDAAEEEDDRQGDLHEPRARPVGQGEDRREMRQMGNGEGDAEVAPVGDEPRRGPARSGPAEGGGGEGEREELDGRACRRPDDEADPFLTGSRNGEQHDDHGPDAGRCPADDGPSPRHDGRQYARRARESIGAANTIVAAYLFLAFACFYLLGSGRHLNTPDAVVAFRTTESLAHGRLAIQELERWPGFGGMRGVDGRFYAWFGLGTSLAAVPFYALGSVLAPLARETERDVLALDNAPRVYRGTSFHRALWYDVGPANFAGAFRALTVGWTNAIVVAATLSGLFLICRELDCSLRASLLTAVLAGVGSPLWHYAREFFAEPLAGFGLVFFLYFALRGRAPGASCTVWALAGAMLGLSALAKVAHVVLVVPAAVLVASNARHLPPRRAMPRLLACSGAWMLVIAVVAAYNAVRFGSPFETGYGVEARKWTTPLLEGLAGLIMSPGRGLLVYCPLVLLGLAGAPRFAAAHRREALFIGLSLLTLLLLYARWQMWDGGWCWGPRFLLPVVPLLLVPVASLLDHLPARGSWRRALVLAALVLAVLVAASGVLVNQADYHSWLRAHALLHADEIRARGVVNYYELVRWDPTYAPLVRYWGFPAKDDWLVLHALSRPGLVLALCALWAVGLGIGVVGLRRVVRRA